MQEPHIQVVKKLNKNHLVKCFTYLTTVAQVLKIIITKLFNVQQQSFLSCML